MAFDTEFEAACSLVEFMRASNCDPESLPSVDALRPAITYFEPIVRDSGFIQVYNQIERQCESKRPSETAMCTGELIRWVEFLTLVLNACARSEDLIICAQQRAYWLATFASFVLHMNVRIFWAENEWAENEWAEPLWQCAGSRSALTICLNPAKDSNILKLCPPERSCSVLQTCCTATEFFPHMATNLKRWGREWEIYPECTDEQAAEAVGFICDHILESPECAPIRISKFHSVEVLLSVAESLSVPAEPFLRGMKAECYPLGTSYEDRKKSKIYLWGPYVAATVVALADADWRAEECTFIKSHDSNDYEQSSLTQIILQTFHHRNTSAALKLRLHGSKSSDIFLKHLSLVLLDMRMYDELEAANIHGVSALDMSIFSGILMAEEPTSLHGKTLSIRKGRLSYEGTLRELIRERKIWGELITDAVFAERCGVSAKLTTHPQGIAIRPHHSTGFFEAVAVVELDAVAITVRVVARRKAEQVTARRTFSIRPPSISLTRAISYFCDIFQCLKCGHYDRDRPFRPDRWPDEHFVIASFGTTFYASHHTGTSPIPFYFVALSGRPFNQVLQTLLLMEPNSYRISEVECMSDLLQRGILQGDACLECAYQEAKRRNCHTVIMQ